MRHTGYDARVSAFDRFLTLFFSTTILTAGCGLGGPIEVTNPPAGSGGSGGSAGGPSGGGGASNGGAAGNDGDDSPVLVGITPTPSSSDGSVSSADKLQAKLTTLAAGARAGVITVPLDADAAEIEALVAKDTAFYAEHGQTVLISLMAVDRVHDRRPASLTGKSWSGPETMSVIEAAIDQLFAATGDEVRYLTFGRDIDVYLAKHPEHRSAFVTISKQVSGYVKGHPGAPKQISTGIALTTDAPKMESAFQDLIETHDLVAFSYFPGLLVPDPEPASGVAATVDQITGTVGQRRIALIGTGFASDVAANGGEAAQQAFLSTLFGAVIARRASFELVNVVELFDASAEDCAAWASSQGEPPDGALAAYACSLGLLNADGTPRPAWSAALFGTAALATP